MNLPNYTIGQAAKILGLSIETLRRYDRSGKITVRRTPGGKRYFTSEDIEAIKGFIKKKNGFQTDYYPTNYTSHSPSSVQANQFSSITSLLILVIISLIGVSGFFFSQTPYPQVLGSQTQNIALDLKQKVGEFLVWLLPDDFKYKALTSSELIKVTGENILLGEGEETTTVGGNLSVIGQSEFSDLKVLGNLDVSGDTTLNTLRTNTLQSGPSSFSGDLTLSSDTPKVVISDTKTLTITDGTNTLLSLSDLGTVGVLNITGDIDITGIYKVGGSKGQTKSACGSSQYLGGIGVSGGILTSTGDCKDISLSTAAGWVDDGTTIRLETSTDTVGIGTTSPSSKLQVNTQTTTQIGQIIKAVSSQTADLLQLRNSVDTILAKIDSDGDLTARTLESTVGTGTAPLVVASTTQVTNLNASQLEGNSASTLMSQPQPNLILNSDFSRRNKWMTFMPEVFSDVSGVTVLRGGAPSAASNQMTGGTADAGDANRWIAREGLITWRDALFSGQVQFPSSGGIPALGKMADADNFVIVHMNTTSTNIYKRVAGTFTSLASTGFTPTANNWYWLELEAQGTKYIAKVYSSGASPTAKASATLQFTMTADVTDSAVVSGSLGYFEDSAQLANRVKWGGLSAGDGGVYVEGWGPEGITPTFNGTVKGGEAFGFDESADSGPIGKQWTLRAFIPASNRRITINNAAGENALPDGSISPGVTYAYSTYIKTSGKSGTGFLVKDEFQPQNSSYVAQGAPIAHQDAGETTWTPKGSSSTVSANARRGQRLITFGDNSTSSGTAFVTLAQLEQGSTVTPWRNAPADDGDIVWFRNLCGPAPTPTYSFASSASWSEINPKQGAANIFVPWDATIGVTFEAAATNDGFEVQLRPTIDGSGATANYSKVIGTTKEPIFLLPFSGGDGNFDDLNHRVNAGKHRVAVEQKHTSGTLTLYCDPRIVFEVRAKRGKYDLAEEYSIEDQSIEAGDVVKLSGLGGTIVEKVVGGYDQSVLGIISTAPGITLSSQVELNSYQEKLNLRPVALQGRIPVKVTNENGSIKRGDILTSSATKPGYAMKATRAGRSIGIAMEDLVGTEGKIMTFVNLSFFDPDVYLADSGELVIAKANTTLSTILGDTTEFSSSETTTVDGLYTLSNINTKETIERIGAFNELFVANLKVGRLDASELRIDEYESKLSSFSARLELLEGLYAGEPFLSSNSGVLSSLTVQEKTLLNDLGITGTITAGLLSIDGLNSSISSLTELKFKLPGGEVTIDTNGNLKIKKLNVDETGNSIGSVVLLAGQTEAKIQTSALTPNSYVFATPNKPVALGITKNESTIFVTIKEALSEDLRINWWVVN